MKRRTKLYNSKRETICELLDCKKQATKLDSEVIDIYVEKINNSKSTIELNRLIKKVNKTWKAVELPTF